MVRTPQQITKLFVQLLFVQFLEKLFKSHCGLFHETNILRNGNSKFNYFCRNESENIKQIFL